MKPETESWPPFWRSFDKGGHVMCLSNAYKETGTDTELLCQYVSNVEVKDGVVLLTTLTGEEMNVEGTVKKIDLINNTVIIGAA